MSELLSKILEFADELDMFPESGLVLACVSGGADSMCLLEALRHISYERGFEVSVAHYNHGLRGGESDRDEAFVRDYCAACGVQVYSGDGDVRAYAKNHSLSIEVAARDVRYRFFYDMAETLDAKRIATAHTADDNAETIVLNLARGAGAVGLSGIPPIRGNIIPNKNDTMVIRPMLRVSKEDVLSFLDGRGIPFVEDSTNELDIYTRNKIRHTVIPVLKEINPRFNEAAAVASELLRADEELVADIADLFIDQLCVGYTANIEDLLTLPFAVSSRVIRKLYAACRGDADPTTYWSLAFKYVKAVLELCTHENPSASLSLPGLTVYREYDRIVFAPKQKPGSDSFSPVYLTDGDSAIILSLGLKISCKSVVCGDKINKAFTSFLFKSDDICGKIAVRPRREGDEIRILGQNCTKTLKKLFIEYRVPVRKRAHIPVIADDNGVLAIYGLGVGERAVPEPGDSAIQIDFEEVAL
jgi:tRNA(Ile)-lysidine synthase